VTTGDDDHQLYRELYDQAPCGYLSTRLDGTITRVNGTLLDWTGYASDELVGLRRFRDLLAPGARTFYETHQLDQLERTGELRGVTLDLIGRDGEPLPVLLRSVIAQAPSGDKVIRTTVLDATERRTYERALLEAREHAEQSAQRLRTVQLVTEACASAVRIDELGRAVVAAAARAGGFAGVALWLPAADGPRLERVAADGRPADEGPEHVDADGPAATARAAREQRNVLARSAVHVPIPGAPAGGGVLVCHLHPGWTAGEDDLALLRTLATQVGQALQRAALHEALEHRAFHDDLTGLPNRALLRDRFDVTVARAARAGSPTAVLVVDMNGFKAVNDRLGHAAGDRVLVEAARRIAESVRPGDTVARTGGDEFAVLCEGADAATAASIAERVRAAVALTVAGADEDGLRVTASVGTALRSGEDERGLDDLLHQADLDMYARKRMQAS
jgi:diguanylate cyclase (GGDEF)-like protein/PAS domain S-box-containing protein